MDIQNASTQIKNTIESLCCMYFNGEFVFFVCKLNIWISRKELETALCNKLQEIFLLFSNLSSASSLEKKSEKDKSNRLTVLKLWHVAIRIDLTGNTDHTIYFLIVYGHGECKSLLLSLLTGMWWLIAGSQDHCIEALLPFKFEELYVVADVEQDV